MKEDETTEGRCRAPPLGSSVSVSARLPVKELPTLNARYVWDGMCVRSIVRSICKCKEKSSLRIP